MGFVTVRTARSQVRVVVRCLFPIGYGHLDGMRTTAVYRYDAAGFEKCFFLRS